MSKKNQKTTQNKQSNSVRIIALILAALMLAGTGAIVAEMIGGMCSTAQTTTTADPHAGHNH